MNSTIYHGYIKPRYKSIFCNRRTHYNRYYQTVLYYKTLLTENNTRWGMGSDYW